MIPIPDNSPVWRAPLTDEDCRRLWLEVMVRAIEDSRGNVICRDGKTDERRDAVRFLYSDDAAFICALLDLDYGAVLTAAARGGR